MKQQSGFTLIELVVVIVLLGILGAAATAKFQDLSTEARIAAVQGVAGEYSSGAAINYGKRAASGTSDVDLTDCADNAQANSLVSSSNIFGTKYTLTAISNCTGSGSTATCNIVDANAATISSVATVICTGP